MRPRVRVAVAALLSCSVYALPLVGPHAAFFLGETLAHAVTRGDQPAAWIAAEFGVALAMQLAAAGIWYWVLGRPVSPRLAVVLIAIPAFFAFAQWCYLLGLPTYFLIEKDARGEQRTWSLACSIPNQSLVVVGYKPLVVRGGDRMTVTDSATRLARVQMAAAADRVACDLAALDVPTTSATEMITPAWLGQNGRVLFQATAKQGGAQSWWWVSAAGAPPTRLAEPPARRSVDGGPVISHDGRAVAWLTPVPDSGQPPKQSVVIRHLPPDDPARDEITIGLDALGLGTFVLREVDLAAREIVLAVNERQFVTVGFDGAPRGAPVRPEGVEPLHMTFRRVATGWVAWDGYTERAYGIAWSLPAGRGLHHVPKGRGITDIAVQPDGRLIAVSVTTSLSIGDVRDAVYVLRTSDGAEVFRRYLVRYARSPVMFPARDLFAYTEWDGTRAQTVVLRVPADLVR